MGASVFLCRKECGYSLGKYGCDRLPAGLQTRRTGVGALTRPGSRMRVAPRKRDYIGRPEFNAVSAAGPPPALSFLITLTDRSLAATFNTAGFGIGVVPT